MRSMLLWVSISLVSLVSCTNKKAGHIIVEQINIVDTEEDTFALPPPPPPGKLVHAGDVIGKWYSADNDIVLVFKGSLEFKYHLKKGVRVVPDYNMEEARYSINGNLLREQQGGGGGIDVTHLFELSHDTLVIYYRANTIKYTFRRIGNNKFRSLTGRDPEN